MSEDQENSPRDMSEINEKSLEIKEYSFEDGLQKLLTKIESLLESQSYVVIGINGSENDVGKTHLNAQLSIQLKRRGIITESCSDPYFLKTIMANLEEDQKYHKKQGGVIIFDAYSFPGVISVKKIEKIKINRNNVIKEKAEELGLPLTKVDIWVGIYRPDKPFEKHKWSRKNIVPLADIIIKNDKASDK